MNTHTILNNLLSNDLDSGFKTLNTALLSDKNEQIKVKNKMQTIESLVSHVHVTYMLHFIWN